MDWKFAFEIFAFFAGSGGLLAILFFGGRWVGRMEAASDRIGQAEESLKQIPSIKQHLAFHDDQIRTLDGKHDSTRVHAIRAEAHSQHDGEE